MFFYQREKFNGGHLKRNGYILVCINHNHIIFVFVGVQIGTPVICCDINIIRQGKIFFCKLRDFFIDFNTVYVHITKVFPALNGICSRTHAKDQHIHVCGVLIFNHQRRSHCIIIIISRKSAVFHVNRLDTEKHICGKNHLRVGFFHLEVVVHGFSFIHKIGFPERKRV